MKRSRCGCLFAVVVLMADGVDDDVAATSPDLSISPVSSRAGWLAGWPAHEKSEICTNHCLSRVSTKTPLCTCVCIFDKKVICLMDLILFWRTHIIYIWLFQKRTLYNTIFLISDRLPSFLPHNRSIDRSNEQANDRSIHYMLLHWWCCTAAVACLLLDGRRLRHLRGSGALSDSR